MEKKIKVEQAQVEEGQLESPNHGMLAISVISGIGLIPIQNAHIKITVTGQPELEVGEFTTNESGSRI